jgi:hydantoinase/carbamoylase family amidase
MSNEDPADLQSGAARVLERLEQLFAVGRGPPAHRLGLSPDEQAAHRLASGWMAEQGLQVEVDAAGNLFGRRPGRRPELPEVWTGSHLDSVPAGGRFDGALGVIAALEAVAWLADARLDRTVAVVAFRDEEGVRFGRSCFGSRALCGRLEEGELDSTDSDGVSVREALARLGLPGPSDPAHGWLPSPSPRCFLELHVEQGPVLAGQDATLGVVTSITGLREHRVRFIGRKGHAGTTPMAGRSDAFVAAAAFRNMLDGAARARDGVVATVGRVSVAPNAPNVIPELVELSVDSRAASDPAYKALAGLVEEHAERAAAEHRVEVEVELALQLEPVPLDPRVQAELEHAAGEAGARWSQLPSGAGHDAAVLAQAGVPAGMLFARSLAEGVSHSPLEHTDGAAVADSIGALRIAVSRLARQAKENE